MALDRVPFTVITVSFDLGDEPQTGHYRTALWDDRQWHLLDDAPPETVPRLPDLAVRT